MEPLASANGSIVNSRSIAALQASHQSDDAGTAGRGVSFVQSKIQGNESPSSAGLEQRHPGDPQSERRLGASSVESTAVDTTAVKEGLASARERLANPPELAVSAQNTGVTYRLFPEIHRTQGRVVDRATADTVRSVPDDTQIQLAQRYEQYIGSEVDVLA